MRDLWTRRMVFFLLGGLFGVYTPEPARLAVLGVFVMLGVRVGLWKPRDFFGIPFRSEILVLAFGILVGIIYGYTGSANLEHPLVLNRIQVTGELLDWDINNDGGIGSFRVLEPIGLQDPEAQIQPDFRNKKYRLRVYVNTKGELPEGWQSVQPGDIVRFTGKLEHPKPPGTAGQFDFPLYYAVRGFAGGLTAQGEAELVSAGTPPMSWVVRTSVRKVLERVPSSQTGLLEGILFGDTSRIPEEDLERYRITGVYHVFSASGANVAFLLLLCWGILKFLPLPLRVGVSIFVLAFYAVLCGGNPPILRATVMGIFVLLGRLGSGRGHSLRGLFIATFLLFIWQPLILKDIGFQLSFMATWGILVLGPKLMRIRWIQRWPQPIRVAFAATCAAQIATFPFLIASFHRFSLIGLMTNLSVLFIMGSIFELGMVGIILSFLPLFALPLFQVSLWLLSIMSELLFQLARVPFADAWVINPGVLFWVYWYGGILSFLLGKERVVFILRVWILHVKKWLNLDHVRFLHSFREVLLGKMGFKLKNAKRIDLAHALFLMSVLLFLWSPWNTARVLEITFIDVGQGDSVLIETPNGKKILVDTGPKSERFDAGERIVLPYLLEKGIKHLDALILTHSHADHVGGAAALLETIPVDWVGVPEDGRDWLSGEGINVEKASNSGRGEVSGIDRELVEQLGNVRLERLKSGDQFILDSDIQLNVLAPGEVLKGTHSDENNNSLILRIENKAGQSVLLTADMEEEEMETILKTGQDISADLFKVPHHGSRFSLVTDWLDQIDPEAVIIPVGRNSFGHPNLGVLNYWQDRHVPIYRTDEDGTVRVKVDEKGIEVIPGRVRQ